MAKKSFLNKAQQAISEEILPPEEPVKSERKGRGEYEDTLRIKEARKISIQKIKPDTNQPRKSIENNSLKELAASIAQHGLLQPIVVEYVETADYFKIINGERRYRAALMTELTHLPCIVRATNKKERLALQLIENIQREDLNPVDKARGLLEFRATLGEKTQWKRVEEITGISERRRQQFLALLELPENLQKEIVSLGKKPTKSAITEKHARALLRLKKYPDKQLDLFNKIKDGDSKITGEEAIKMAKEMLGGNAEILKRRVFKYKNPEDLIKQLEEAIKKLRSEL